MDAQTALAQIKELIDDVEAEMPDVAAGIREAVNAERGAPKPEEDPRPPEMPEADKPSDFKSATKNAAATFGRDKPKSDEEADPNEKENDGDPDDKKKKRDKGQGFF